MWAFTIVHVGGYMREREGGGGEGGYVWVSVCTVDDLWLQMGVVGSKRIVLCRKKNMTKQDNFDFSKNKRKPSCTHGHLSSYRLRACDKFYFSLVASKILELFASFVGLVPVWMQTMRRLWSVTNNWSIAFDFLHENEKFDLIPKLDLLRQEPPPPWGSFSHLWS